MSAPRHRMSGVDTAWLHMHDRTNPMVIVGVTVLGEPCSLEALKALVRERLLAYERFRWRPVEDPLGTAWAEDTVFDLDRHVVETPLGPRASQADLEALVGRLASTPLDDGRPLWRYDLVPDFEGGSAIVSRYHHCYADGIALVKLFLSLTSARPDGDFLAPLPERGDHHEDEAALPWLRTLMGPAAGVVGEALAAGNELVETSLRNLLNPLEALGTARQAAGMAGEFASLMQLPDDPPTPFRGTLGPEKRVAWAPPLPLPEVRTVAKALGCTINDVLVSVVAGTLGRLLRSMGESTDGLVIRAAIPVNLRAPDDPPTLGNRFGLVFLPLPVGLVHPLERLYAVRDAMRALKGSAQPAVVLAVLSALGRLPAALQSLAIDQLSGKASVVLSNVPGPRMPLYFCGKPIVDMHFWVPQSGRVGVGISILTYADAVLFGVISDRLVLAEPHALVDGFAAEFERLLLLTALGAAHTRRPAAAGAPAKARQRAATPARARRRAAPSRPRA